MRALLRTIAKRAKPPVEVDPHRDLAIYLCARFLSGTATLILSVAVGWRVYEISGSPLVLGFLGLAQFIPRLVLSLPGGELCDRLEPRRILGAGLLLQALV